MPAKAAAVGTNLKLSSCVRILRHRLKAVGPFRRARVEIAAPVENEILFLGGENGGGSGPGRVVSRAVGVRWG